MKKTVMWGVLVLFLCMIGVVGAVDITGYTITNMLISDTFDYSDTYTNHSWGHYTFGSSPTKPIAVRDPLYGDFSGGAYGVDKNNSGSYSTFFINRSIPSTPNSGRYIIAFDYADLASPQSNGAFYIYIYNDTGSSPYPADNADNIFQFYVVGSMSFNTTPFSVYTSNLPQKNMQKCYWSGNTPKDFGKIVIDLDIDNDKYSVYFNNSIMDNIINPAYAPTYICKDRMLFNATGGREFHMKHIMLGTGSVPTSYKLQTFMDNFELGEGYVVNATNVTVSNYSCVDSDNQNYTNYGYINFTIVGSNITYYDECVSTYDLQEQTCSGTTPDYVIVNCSANFSECYQGVCVIGNQYPSIINVTSYRYGDNGFLDHNAYYKANRSITFNVTSSDYENDQVSVGVDCIYGDMFGANVWYQSSYTPNCTYSSYGTYTARIYAMDGGVHGWDNYTIYQDVNVTITQCDLSQDCNAGYSCYLGTCTLLNATYCTDSDSGINVNVTGTITTDLGNITDSCYNIGAVKEYFCNSSYPDLYFYALISCGAGFKCASGSCVVEAGFTEFVMNFKDASTNAWVSGVAYTLTDLNTSIVYTGVANGVNSVAVPLDHSFKLEVRDSSAVYKAYTDLSFIPPEGDYNVMLYRHCSGACLLNDDFSVFDSVLKHGWISQVDRFSTNPDGYSYSMTLNLSDSFQMIYQIFPMSSDNLVTVQYDLIMADSVPAEGQELWVYIGGDTGTSNYDLVQLRYVVNTLEEVQLYYMSGATWIEIPQGSIKYSEIVPFSTKVVIDRQAGTFDVWLDRTASGAFVKYTESLPIIQNHPVNMINFFPLPSPNDRTLYIDNVGISQATSSNESEGSITNPSGADLDSVWYRDVDGNLKFDRTKCEGWNTFIGCALFKTGVNKATGIMAWAFKGTHLILIILCVVVFILIAPLMVELFRKR